MMVGLALAAAGCGSLRPKTVAEADLAEVNQADKLAALTNMTPLSGTLTLEEAIARALKFNLDRRSKLMEEAIAVNQLDASRFDMLPKLTAQAGYRTRDQETTVRSKDSVTGAPSLSNPSISHDATHILPHSELAGVMGGTVAVREVEGRLIPEQAVYRVTLLATKQPIALAGQSWRGRVMVEAEPESLAERVAKAALALWWREAGW